MIYYVICTCYIQINSVYWWFQVILPAMKQHPKELSVQMAATACLYNLTKADMGQKVHPKWLSQVVDLTMTAMQNFPNHQQVRFYMAHVYIAKVHSFNVLNIVKRCPLYDH